MVGFDDQVKWIAENCAGLPFSRIHFMYEQRFGPIKRYNIRHRLDKAEELYGFTYAKGKPRGRIYRAAEEYAEIPKPVRKERPVVRPTELMTEMHGYKIFWRLNKGKDGRYNYANHGQ